MATQTIKAWDGMRILGTVEEDSQGNKTVKDFVGRRVAYYDKASNVTKDASFRSIAFGDVASGFLLKGII